jgi:cell division protein FtsI (penicillin-binding protein 3)
MVCGTLGLCSVALIARALDLQVIDHAFYQQQGDARFVREIPIATSRGMITDRNGEPLAISSPVESIWGNPKELLKAPARLPALARALGMPQDELASRLSQRAGKEFVYLKRRINPDEAARILALDIPGVSSQREYRRFYPQGEAVAHVLGFTNIDDRGQEGLELAFDDWLRGTPGAKRVIRDRRGQIVENVDLVRAAQPGRDLALSIDRRIQYLAHRELRNAMNDRASSGSAVVLDVATGEVLAMVNLPTFNPNAVGTSPARRAPQPRGDRPAGAGLDDEAADRGGRAGSGRDHLDIAVQHQPGLDPERQVPHHRHPQLRRAGYHRHHPQEFERRRVAGRQAPERCQFDLPAPLRLWPCHRQRLPGRGRRPVPESPSPLERHQQADHQLWLRPERHAAADRGRICALGNGGMLAPAQLRQGPARTRASRCWTRHRRPVLHMMQTVTEPGGTATQAAILGYHVAGKTGTSRKASAGGYSRRYIGYFAGLVPVEKPRFAMVVAVNDPTKGSYYGGVVAARCSATSWKARCA